MNNLAQNSDYLAHRAEVEEAAKEQMEGLLQVSPEDLKYKQGFIAGMRHVNNLIVRD